LLNRPFLLQKMVPAFLTRRCLFAFNNNSPLQWRREQIGTDRMYVTGGRQALAGYLESLVYDVSVKLRASASAHLRTISCFESRHRYLSKKAKTIAFQFVVLWLINCAAALPRHKIMVNA
jgi:hypothetical protein